MTRVLAALVALSLAGMFGAYKLGERNVRNLIKANLTEQALERLEARGADKQEKQELKDEIDAISLDEFIERSNPWVFSE